MTRLITRRLRKGKYLENRALDKWILGEIVLPGSLIGDICLRRQKEEQVNAAPACRRILSLLNVKEKKKTRKKHSGGGIDLSIGPSVALLTAARVSRSRRVYLGKRYVARP